MGSPATPSTRGHTVISAPSERNRATTAGSASVGTNTSSRRRPAAATTAAAKAALPQLAIASGRGGPSTMPSRRTTSRWTRSPKRWRALCDPATLPVSSFTQTVAAVPRPSASPGADGERRHCEAVSVYPRHLAVEIAHQFDEGLIAHAVGGGEMIGVKQTAPADERVRLRGLEREVQLVDVEEAAQDVVPAVTGTRAAERVGLGDLDNRAATAADDGAGEPGGVVAWRSAGPAGTATVAWSSRAPFRTAV